MKHLFRHIFFQFSQNFLINLLGSPVYEQEIDQFLARVKLNRQIDQFINKLT